MSSPSQLEISDEGMVSLWDGLRRDLDDLASPCRLPDGFLEITASRFLNEGTYGPHDILEVVTSPAGGAGDHVMIIRFTGAFYRYATRSAQDSVCSFRH